MKLGRRTYRITYDCGHVRYVRALATAVACYKAGAACGRCDAGFVDTCEGTPEALHKVRLTHDAVERLLNEEGGYEAQEWQLLPATPTKESK
jgi:hypothetical protein